MFEGLMIVAAIAGAAQSPQPRNLEAPVHVEFRIFDGATEITSTATIRVQHSGTDERGTVLGSRDLSVDLLPGVYNAEATCQKPGDTRAIRTAEHLVVMAYPDEGGRHLEVINFTSGFGALELRWADEGSSDTAGTAITMFKLGDAHAVAVRPARGNGYLLLVVPADTYDIRITRPAHDPFLLAGVEIPEGSTRLKIVR